MIHIVCWLHGHAGGVVQSDRSEFVASWGLAVPASAEGDEEGRGCRVELHVPRRHMSSKAEAWVDRVVSTPGVIEGLVGGGGELHTGRETFGDMASYWEQRSFHLYGLRNSLRTRSRKGPRSDYYNSRAYVAHLRSKWTS